VEDGGRERLSRRVLLRQAAKVGGTIAWTIPLIQTVDIRAAAALSGSAPPSEQLPDSEPQAGDLGGGGGAPAPSLLEITDVTTAPNPLRLHHDHGLRISGFVSQAAAVQVMITRADKVVRRLFNGQTSAAGWISASWDGKGRRGKKVRPGRYAVVVVGEDGSGGTVKATLRFRVTP
jgi:hypothetical protein